MKSAATGAGIAMADASGVRPDYERSDADPRLICLLALGGAAFLVLAPVILSAVYPLARHEPLARAPESIPGPRLQIDPGKDLRASSAAASARLSSYGWIHQPGGILHLPIDRAMRLTAERGLPGWPQP